MELVSTASLNGTIKAEIAFHPPAGRINQILYDYVGWRYQFDANGEEAHEGPTSTPSLRFRLALLCRLAGYLRMSDDAFLFWALPLLEAARMTAEPRGPSLSSLSLLYQTRGSGLQLRHLISVGLNRQETAATRKV